MSAWKIFLYWCAAVIISVAAGGMAVSLFSDISWLSWISHSAGFGFAPTVLDLSIIKFTIGFWLNINICQIILLAVSTVLFYFIKR